MSKPAIAIFWFRRDLRLADNTGLYHALSSGLPVVPIFIFDDDILEKLPRDDARVNFIHESLHGMDTQLQEFESGVLVKKGMIATVWKELTTTYNVKKVFFNKDYEPYAIKRDEEIKIFLEGNGVEVYSYKDDVIFEEKEVLKDDGTPYKVFTPYKNRWLQTFKATNFENTTYEKKLLQNCYTFQNEFRSLKSIGFTESSIKVKPYNLEAMNSYEDHRNFPAQDKTSYLSPHVRFGTVSIRKLVTMAMQKNATFLSELIWREFFKVILFHFPKVVTNNFRAAYDGVQWRNNPEDFEKWCEGKTGYPIVDAGMRELNATGYMHNRTRMVVASFLCKHLLIDWRLGEGYFAEKLLDYELSSNNGNWQWAAGTGCDASPYFRVFNPESQQKKFDKDCVYIRKWVQDFDELTYPQPMVEHKFARERAIATYKAGIVR
jgi:deoxyribodipyrimidine photo-lyase